MKTLALSEKVSEQLYGMYHVCLPQVDHRDSKDSFMETIDYVLSKGRYLLSFDEDNKLAGFVESYRINDLQVKRLIERSFDDSIVFDVMRENITEGPICWLENIAIHFEYRTPRWRGPVQRDLIRQYFKQNRDAEVHMGHKIMKTTGLIKILHRKREV